MQRGSKPPTVEKEELASIRPAASSDVALIHGRSADGKGLSILRHREGRLEAGEVRALEHGKPIVGDVVTLKPRQGVPWLCDVETHVSSEASEVAERATRGRPAQVANERYRNNWDSIYKPRDRESLN